MPPQLGAEGIMFLAHLSIFLFIAHVSPCRYTRDWGFQVAAVRERLLNLITDTHSLDNALKEWPRILHNDVQNGLDFGHALLISPNLA